MGNINPPTGNEQPRKYYGSPYLDEVIALEERVRHETAEGRDIDVSDEHPLTINEVNPELLTPEQKKDLENGNVNFDSEPEPEEPEEPEEPPVNTEPEE